MSKSRSKARRGVQGQDREPSRAGGSPSLKLAFRAVSCSRCGTRREATQPCASCGKPAQPGEFDVKAQRRNNAAVVLRGMLRSDVEASSEAVDLGDLLGSLADLPERMVSALNGLDAGGQAEASSLAAAKRVIEDVRSARASLARDWDRPWRRYARMAREPVDDLEGALASLVDAFAAADIGSAQMKQAEMQSLLDASTGSIQVLNEDLRFASEVLHLSESDLLSRCIVREADRLGLTAGGIDAMTELDKAGRKRLPVLADDGSPGVGLQVQAVLLPASVLLDSDWIVELCCEAHPLLRTERLRSLALDPGWTAFQRAGTTALMDACQRLARLADLPQRPVRQDVREALIFVQDVVEGPLRHLLATVIACATSELDLVAGYAAARGATGSGVVTAARKRLPSALTTGIPVVARHASAHLDFVVEPDGVLLQASLGPKASRMTFESLTDAVLALMETALALQLAVLAACDGKDLLPDDSDLADELDPDLLSKFMLASIGWRDVRIEREGQLLRVTGESALPSPMGTIGMLLSRLPDDITDVELVARTTEGSKVLTAKTAPFRRWNARPDPDDEFESNLLFTDALAEVSFGGEPVVNAAMVRHMAAVTVGQQVNGDLADAARRFVRVRDWARRYEDAELDEALRATHRALTSMRVGLAPSISEQAAIALVSEWEQRATPIAVGW